MNGFTDNHSITFGSGAITQSARVSRAFDVVFKRDSLSQLEKLTVIANDTQDARVIFQNHRRNDEKKPIIIAVEETTIHV